MHKRCIFLQGFKKNDKLTSIIAKIYAKTRETSFYFTQCKLTQQSTSSDLSTTIKVSEDTIRRDLQELSEDNKLIKVHGGALSKSFHSSFNNSSVYAIESKKCIAQKAVSLIKDGMFVLTSGGTTIIELARALPESLHATFITGSIRTAL